MDKNIPTIATEDQYFLPVFNKTAISVEKGDGIYVFDENNRRYIDFTSGWGVTCIGHANPVITDALNAQSRLIIQNPDSGKTYSPARARLLQLMQQILPDGLTRVFFTNSGAEANDAAIKLARKITGRKNVISTINSFHGRTISTASATGQAVHRDKYAPLMPNYIFTPYDSIPEIERIITSDVAAVIVEPIQGEGGIIVPSEGYLKNLSGLCRENGVLLIVDEIQTGFLRTGDFFCSEASGAGVDFMTMAKGIAGGFPFGAFAVTEEVAQKIEKGDHGGTYCGNPLGCAVSYSVIRYMLDNNLGRNVKNLSAMTFDILSQWKKEFIAIIKDVRGMGLLIAIEFSDSIITSAIQKRCLENGLIVNVTHGNIIRLFPALNIREREMLDGLEILKEAIAACPA